MKKVYRISAMAREIPMLVLILLGLLLTFSQATCGWIKCNAAALTRRTLESEGLLLIGG